jgi:glutathione synthase/RimK-type ligase-like ATP-grasp enzyme
VAVAVTEAEAELALRAAEALGVEAAGVDLLPGPDGEWYILEVNAVPGWRALAPVAGVDVAAAIVRHAVGRVRR